MTLSPSEQSNRRRECQKVERLERLVARRQVRLYKEKDPFLQLLRYLHLGLAERNLEKSRARLESRS